MRLAVIFAVGPVRHMSVRAGARAGETTDNVRPSPLPACLPSTSTAAESRCKPAGDELLTRKYRSGPAGQAPGRGCLAAGGRPGYRVARGCPAVADPATELERPRSDLYGGSGSRVSRPVWARNPVLRSGRCSMCWSRFRTMLATVTPQRARAAGSLSMRRTRRGGRMAVRHGRTAWCVVAVSLPAAGCGTAAHATAAGTGPARSWAPTMAWARWAVTAAPRPDCARGDWSWSPARG